MNASVPNHQFDMITPAECLDRLERVVKPHHALIAWRGACDQANVNPAQLKLTSDRLETVLMHLSLQPGLAGVVGTSLCIRVRTARLLAEPAHPTTPQVAA